MRLRSVPLLCVLTSVVAALLVSAPAEAASRYVSVSTRSVVISSAGNGKVWATCHHKTRSCRGTAYFAGDHKVPVAYAIPARSKKWIALKVSKADAQSPWGSTPGSGPLNARAATLRINENSPRNVSHDQKINAERWQQYQQITGRVAGPSPAPSDLVVTLWRNATGRGTPATSTRQVSVGGTFSFNVPLGTNNAASSAYQLSVSGNDQDGHRRSWFWRGVSGRAHGGGKYVREASPVRASKTGPFVADFDYGTIKGRVVRKEDTAGVGSATVTVAAPPVSFSGGVATTRELDLEGCANVLGETDVDANGYYAVGFLPTNHATSDQRYLVRASSPVARDSQGRLMTGLWNNSYGTCSHALGYATSRANLIPLTAAAPTYDASRSNLALEYPTGSVYVNATYSGFSPTTDGDRWVSLREYLPGRKILSSKVVKYGRASYGGIKDLTGVAPGRYWLEVGRRTSCSAWYGSRFTNNKAYLNGADRGAESWKTVAGKYAEHQKSYDMGYRAKTPPSGAKGWMYRDHCASSGKGYYVRITVGRGDRVIKRPVLRKGATITGHVSRTGGRTNKEMLVSVYSTKGVLVMRTHLTNGGGNFTIRGLASGNYRIKVNADSWRGIGRTFSGTKTKRVTAGKTYKVGTLKFKG